MKSNRLSFLAYRCTLCRRLITCYEIERTWERMEREGKTSKSICPCGGNKISPSNPLLWEELFLPRVWELWWRAVVLPRFGR